MSFARLPALTPLTLLCAAPFLAWIAETPRFEPKEGSVVKRTLEMKGTRELVSQAMELGDERQVVPGASLHMDVGWKYVVSDTYGKCAGDRALSLTRKYASLEKGRTEKSKDQAGADKTRQVDETCDLAGKTVVFQWNADKSEYKAAFDGGDEGDESLLTGLAADMDYREFLPEADAQVGAKWERDFADLKLYFLRPGGDLPFHGETPARPLDLAMRAAVWDANQGRVEFELKPATEDGGKKFARIHFEGTNKVDASAEAEAGEKGPKSLAMIDEQKFEGELVWDMAAGRARSIEWSAKGTMILKVSMAAKTNTGEDATLVQALTFDTAYDYTGSFELE